MVRREGGREGGEGGREGKKVLRELWSLADMDKDGKGGREGRCLCVCSRSLFKFPPTS